MASRVNTKFVVGLSVAVIAIFGAGAFLGLRVMKNSPEKLIKAGDEKAAAGDYKEAEKLYAKGVNKAQTNIAYMEKWKDSLTKSTYGTRVAFEEKYGQYLSLLRQMAAVQQTNVAAHREYLDVLMQSASRSAQRAGYDNVARAAEEAMNFFKADPNAGEALRRYRGIAMARVFALTGELKPEEVAQGLEDLERAVKADPKDGEAAEALTAIHQMRADAAKKEQRIEDQKNERRARDEFIASYLAANPKEPRMLFQKLRSQLEIALEEKLQGQTGEAAQAAYTEIQNSLKPALQETAAALEAAPRSAIDVGLLSRFQGVEQFVEPSGQGSRTEAILRKHLERAPDDVELMMALAGTLAERREYANAVAMAQKIVEMPPRPIGVAGLLLYPQRTQALVLRAMWQVKHWGTLTKDDEKAAALAKAKEYRDDLKKAIDEASPEAMFVDAQIAYAENDLATADKLLTRYNQARRDSDPEGLWLAAQTKLRKPNPETGLAREQLRRIVNELQPGNWTALVQLGQIEAGLQNYPEALDYFQRAQRLKGDDEEVNRQVRLLQQVIKGEKIDDPVVEAMMTAQKMREQGKSSDELIAHWRQAVDATKDDPRLVRAYLIEQLAAGKREEAKAYITDLAARKPDVREFKVMEQELTTQDPMASALAMIDAAPITDVEKATRKFGVYRQYGKPAEAKAELAKAAALAPNDAGIIELQFVTAIDENDLAGAAKFAEQAAKTNADRENGDTFRARLEMAKGDAKRGVQIMEEVVKRGTATPEALRLLGRARIQAGETAKGVEDFRRALAARPNDVSAGLDLINALLIAGNQDAALAEARALEKFGRGNDTFMGLWLSLEGAVGDKEKALDMRQRLMVASPENRPNRLEVARLLVSLKRWDDAKRQIAEIRRLGDGLDVAQLEAALFDAQGEYDKAKGVLEAYIAAQDQAKIGPEPYITLGRYALQRGNVEAALAAYENARKHQDPKRMQGDVELADLLFQIGGEKEDQAVEAARRVIAGGADSSGHIFLKRVIESQTRRGKYDDALKDLETLKSKAPNDPAYLLQLSDIRVAKGDEKGARAALDEAASKFSDNAVVFMKRAQFLARSNEMLRDAKADLDKAVRLAPSMWQAYQMRAFLSERMGKADDAIADMRAAVRAAPLLDDLWERAMGVLLSRDRPDEAAEVAREVIAARPKDVRLMMQIASMFQTARMNERSVEFLKMAYDTEKTPTTSVKYINTLLDLNPPQISKAEEVLQAMRDKMSKDVGLTLARARVLFARNKASDAAAAGVDAAKLLDVMDANGVMAWYDTIQKFMPDSKQMLPYLESIEKAGFIPDWMRFYRANVYFNDSATREQALTMLKELTDATKPRPVRLFAYRAMGVGLYGKEQYERAAGAWRECLEHFPEDHETINNLAYTLAKHLKKAEEALPYAERAAKMRPNTPEVLDTLGYVQMEAGKLEEAKKSLTACVTMDQSPRTLMTALLHQIECHLRLKDETGARAWMDQIEALIAANPKSASNEVKEGMEELRKRLK
jgi:predicted Zn-dependent protease